jgi:hypothetical protein
MFIYTLYDCMNDGIGYDVVDYSESFTIESELIERANKIIEDYNKENPYIPDPSMNDYWNQRSEKEHSISLCHNVDDLNRMQDGEILFLFGDKKECQLHDFPCMFVKCIKV